MQVEACRVIFDTDAHLLLAAGTASGKTEAAFLPILTLLHENPSDSVGVLYVGPLKALINDQFMRLNELLKEAGCRYVIGMAMFQYQKNKSSCGHREGCSKLRQNRWRAC